MEFSAEFRTLATTITKILLKVLSCLKAALALSNEHAWNNFPNESSPFLELINKVLQLSP